jgi:hypothetical protein
VRARIAALAGGALFFAVCDARSAPQANAAFVVGAAGRPVDGAAWGRTDFAGGLRGDLVLGRERARDVGVGPYLTVETFGFSDVRPGAGVTAHVPIHGLLPLLASVGPLISLGDGPATPGVAGRLFWGLRPYNPYGAYALAGGLLLGVDRTFGASGETAFVLAVQIDAALIALPVLLGLQAL